MAQQIESRSPQDPTDVVVSAPAATSGQVRAAVDRARVASREWGTAPAVQRATALHAAADAVAGAATELAALIVREVGKPVGESRGEVARAVAILRYFAQQALDPDGETYPSADGRALLLARHRPRGPVGLITPWNFPIAIPLWKTAPALAFGNAVVLKPAPDASAVAIRLEELVRTVLPDGVLQVVTGSAEAGRALVESVDAVSFTGSASVGRLVAVAAAARGIAAQCEMGGQNPSIVLPDADIEQTAAIIANAAMGYAGQKCTATSRVIVVGDAAPVTQALVAAVEGLASGDPADEATVVGPVITEAARAPGCWKPPKRRSAAGAGFLPARGQGTATGGSCSRPSSTEWAPARRSPRTRSSGLSAHSCPQPTSRTRCGSRTASLTAWWRRCSPAT